jgi:hypothetical protein
LPSVDLHWTVGSRDVEWVYDGGRVEKHFESPPRAVTTWGDPPSVIVVEPIVEGGRLDNAIVFDPSGSERLRLTPPNVVSEPSWRLGFHTAYVSRGVLTVVFSTRVGDFWGRPDLVTGELLDVAEWR